MKLTKDERFTAYCILLVEAEGIYNKKMVYLRCRHFAGGEIGGLCDLLENIIEQEPRDILEFFGLEELLSKKPTTSSFYWFGTDSDGWQERIDILQQCIIETSDF